MSLRTKPVTDDSFSTEVLQSKGIKVVDFWAEWCGPCKALAPTLDALADEYGPRIEIQKLNVDENSRTAAQYEIRGIPTLLIFRDGEIVDRITGNVPRDVLKKSIDAALA